MTTDGTEDHAYVGPFRFSPDSIKLVAMRTRKGTGRKINMVESAPKDELQPKLHTVSYTKPGDDIDKHKPVLFDVVSRKNIPVSDKLFENPWSIKQIRWSPDSSRFTFFYNHII